MVSTVCFVCCIFHSEHTGVQIPLLEDTIAAPHRHERCMWPTMVTAWTSSIQLGLAEDAEKDAAVAAGRDEAL